MEIIVLGSGKMNITKNRSASAYLLKIKNEYLLLDCGHGTFRRLVDLNFNPFKINYLFISHSHTDHIADLMPLIHTQWIEGRNKPLYLIGPKNIKETFKKLKKVMWPEPQEKPNFLKFFPAENSFFNFKSLILKTLPIQHTPLLSYDKFPGLIIKIISDRKSLVYSGDWHSKAINKKLINFIKNADLLIAETSKSLKKVNGGHLNPREVGELADKAKVKKLILTHLSEKDNFKKISSDCKKMYQGKIIVAKDLMRIKI